MKGEAREKAYVSALTNEPKCKSSYCAGVKVPAFGKKANSPEADGGNRRQTHPVAHYESFFFALSRYDERRHRDSKFSRKATVTGVQPPARFGELTVTNGIASEFLEKPKVQNGFSSGAFFVLERSVFEILSDDDTCNFERGPLARLAAQAELAVHPHAGFWQCMDTFRDFTLLNELWEAGSAPWSLAAELKVR